MKVLFWRMNSVAAPTPSPPPFLLSRPYNRVKVISIKRGRRDKSGYWDVRRRGDAAMGCQLPGSPSAGGSHPAPPRLSLPHPVPHCT